MSTRHEFFFLFELDPSGAGHRGMRIAHTVTAAKTHGLMLHREDHPGVTTLQVETDDPDKAVRFKLAVLELPRAEIHE